MGRWSKAQTKKAEREAAKWKRVQKIAKRYRDSEKRRELRRRRGAERSWTLLLWAAGVLGAVGLLLWLLW
jgi:hypothetical protein